MSYLKPASVEAIVADALAVIIFCPRTANTLANVDPMAYRQALLALATAGYDLPIEVPPPTAVDIQRAVTQWYYEQTYQISDSGVVQGLKPPKGETP